MLDEINLIIHSPTFWINSVVLICFIAIIIAVIVDFLLYEEKSETKDKLKSRVATGRMSIFFVVVYLVLRFRIGVYSFPDFQIISIIIGLIIVLFSTFFNIMGRFYLSTNWANNIKIYSDHKLVNSGPYKIVRHPLYASLIWINYGVALIYSNWLVIILATFVFLPMMIYRAGQEEKLLSKNFEEYSKYKKKVGMFFPKFFNRG